MKNLLLLLFTVCTLSAGAQNISGFYSGTLYNDSTKMTQKYELALSEYRGKISGYSYVTFVSNDTFYYGIRKIRAEIVGDSLIVRDDKMLVNNFPEAPAKGVGRVITIPLKGQDSLVVLSGRWKTNQTKKYYSVPGAIELNRSTDSTNSPLISHLKELNIVPSVSYQNTDLLAVKEPVPEPTKPKETKKPIEEAKPQNQSGTTASAKPSRKEKEAKKKEASTSTTNPVNVSHPVAQSEKPVVLPNELSKADRESEITSNTEVLTANNKPSKKEKKAKEQDEKPVDMKPAISAPTVPVTIPYAERKSRHIQTLEVNSDSLVLAFYDNGVVDGDSISVFLNGKEVISHARLRTVATKLPISIAGTEVLTLLLVAENLGSLPPNTGLITIRDGDEVHQVNFNADLQTNNTIIIKRKKE